MTGLPVATRSPSARPVDGRAPVPPAQPAGRRRLTVGDVLILLSAEFWRVPPWGLFLAVRQAAIVAFMALLRFGRTDVTRLRLKDWRPDGRDVVTVRLSGGTENLPVTAELRFVVERYLELRPSTRCPYLFVTRRGDPLQLQTMQEMFRRAGKHLGLTRVPRC